MSDKQFNDLNNAFSCFLKANAETIKKHTPLNPVISSDDEWNDPEYDDDVVSRGWQTAQ